MRHGVHEMSVTLSELFLLLLGLIAGITGAWLVFRTRIALIEGRAKNDLERWKDEHTRAIRDDSVSRSRSVLKGKIAEQMAPVMPDFPYSPTDARFIGSPVDFVVFDGYTEAKDNEGSDIGIVLVEIKKGKSRLTRTESLVRKAAEAGRISWKTIVLDDD